MLDYGLYEAELVTSMVGAAPVSSSMCGEITYTHKIENPGYGCLDQLLVQLEVPPMYNFNQTIYYSYMGSIPAPVPGILINNNTYTADLSGVLPNGCLPGFKVLPYVQDADFITITFTVSTCCTVDYENKAISFYSQGKLCEPTGILYSPALNSPLIYDPLLIGTTALLNEINVSPASSLTAVGCDSYNLQLSLIDGTPAIPLPGGNPLTNNLNNIHVTLPPGFVFNSVSLPYTVVTTSPLVIHIPAGMNMAALANFPMIISLTAGPLALCGNYDIVVQPYTDGTLTCSLPSCNVPSCTLNAAQQIPTLFNVNLSPANPVLNVSGDGCTGYNFTASGGCGNYTWLVDGIASGSGSTFSYNSPQSHIICVQSAISNGALCSGQACFTTQACACCTPYDFSISMYENCKVCINLVSECAWSDNYLIDYGNGILTTDLCFTYTNSGTYSICLYDNCLGQLSQIICHKVTVDCPCDKPCGAIALWNYKLIPDSDCKYAFTDLSTPLSGSSITSWEWYLDGISVSTNQNEIIYIGSGTHDICLGVIATDGMGNKCADKFCQTITCCPGAPHECGGVINGNAHDLGGCIYQFIGSATPNPGAGIYSWFWDFGDGQTSNLQNPVYQYNNSGSYTVTLVVEFIYGDTKCEVKYTFNLAANCDESCEIVSKPSFEVGSCTIYGYGLYGNYSGVCPVNYLWEFGDGTTSTLQNPQHTYSQSGAYVVCLTVWVDCEDFNCSDRFCQDFYMDCPCECNSEPEFTVVQGPDCKVDLTYLDNHDPCWQVQEIKWYMGNGLEISGYPSASYVYEQDGTYDICCTVLLISGDLVCERKTCQTITIDCHGDGTCESCCCTPYDFEMEVQENCTVCLKMVYDCNKLDHYLVDYGDGTGLTTDLCHQYLVSGTYKICLYSTCYNNVTETICYEITVDCPCEQPCGVVARWNYSNVGECKFDFFDASVALPGTTIVNWEWFLDGVSVSNNQNETINIGNGTHTICLIVTATDDAGLKCQNEYCQEITCCESGPTDCGGKTDISFTNMSGCLYQFTGYALPNIGSSIYSWNWYFSDGGFSNQQNPIHQFPGSGGYNVTLVVEFLQGDIKCTVQYDLYIEVNCEETCDIKAKMDYQIDLCTFHGFGYYYNFNSGECAVHFLWDFGDGTTSTLQNPVHTYAQGGNYVVCLTVWVDCYDLHCSDQVCKDVVIDCPCDCTGEPDFTVTQISPCVVQLVYQNNLNSCWQVMDVKWSTGDGQSESGGIATHSYSTPGTYKICCVVNLVNASGEYCTRKYCKNAYVNCLDAMAMAPGGGDVQNNKSHQSELKMTVAPNPNNGQFIVRFSELVQGGKMLLRDNMGRVVASNVVKAETISLEWSVGHLECGMYSLEFTDGKNQLISRIVICE